MYKRKTYSNQQTYIHTSKRRRIAAINYIERPAERLYTQNEVQNIVDDAIRKVKLEMYLANLTPSEPEFKGPCSYIV